MPPLLHLLRPHQWVKNVFVLAGVFFAGALFEPDLVLKALGAFAAFCLMSGAAYALNDWMDRDADQRHPRKRLRPIASGAVSPSAGLTAGAVAAAGGLLVAAALDGRLALLAATYGLVNVAYSRRFKHVVLADVFCIATGFVLRLLAGTWGIGIPPSKWFLLCTFLLSLFLGFSKRYAERTDGNQASGDKRAVVADYTPEFLRALLAATLACTLMAYGLYTMSPETTAVHETGRLIYTVPFAAFVLFRYLYLVMARGYGENLAGELWRDRGLWGGVAAYLAATGGVLFGG